MTNSENKKTRQPNAYSIENEAYSETPHVKEAQKKSTNTRKPRAVSKIENIKLEDTDEDYFAAKERNELEISPPPAKERLRKNHFGLTGLIFAALTFLLSASFGLWVQNLINDLMTQNIWLGRTALIATFTFITGIAIFIIREIYALWRIRAVSELRKRIIAALDKNKENEIKTVSRELESHFQNHPKTAHARAMLAKNQTEIIDAIDRYILTEKELLSDLDKEAKKIVMNAAKRVSVVTAVSPRAIVDIGYVLYENILLIRVLAEHYGGRSGFYGTYALAKKVVSHLAVTGSIAVGDGIIQQLLGHGLAAKLSARLGEGVVNGLMTARVGLAAIDICRPAPFHACPKPQISDFATNLINLSGKKKQNENNKST